MSTQTTKPVPKTAVLPAEVELLSAAKALLAYLEDLKATTLLSARTAEWLVDNGWVPKHQKDRLLRAVREFNNSQVPE